MASLVRAARLTRRNGIGLDAAGARTEGSASNSSVVMISSSTGAQRLVTRHDTLRTQMVSHGLKNRTANRPKRGGNQQNHAERAQPAWIERFLGQGRLDKAGDIDLLAVGVHARAVEGSERVLIGTLRKCPLAFELLIRAHDPGKRFRSRLLGISDFALDRTTLRLERSDPGFQDLYGGSVVAHIMLQGRQLGVGANQFVANSSDQSDGCIGGLARVDDPFLVAEFA